MTIVKKTMTGVLFIAMSVTLFSFDLPTGLFKAGSNPKSYEMGIEKGSGQERVRLSGMVKTQVVSDWSGLWFRIDQKGSQQNLGFDNMHNGKKDRSIKGTTA